MNPYPKQCINAKCNRPADTGRWCHACAYAYHYALWTGIAIGGFIMGIIGLAVGLKVK